MADHGIQVHVEPRFHPDRSSHGQWLFTYTVTISNDGDQPATLRSRHWIITNARGRVEEVRGPGVVGEQPRLDPGDRFVYTSMCPLDTSLGSMHGSFQLERDDGSSFDAAIEPFTLADPATLN